jgi:hypothetical protein
MINLKHIEPMDKIEIIFAKPPIIKYNRWNGRLVEPIEKLEYYKCPSIRSSFYIKFKDTYYYSETLRNLYRLLHKRIRDNINDYIIIKEEEKDKILIKLHSTREHNYCKYIIEDLIKINIKEDSDGKNNNSEK